jgi:ribosomal protein L40E
MATPDDVWVLRCSMCGHKDLSPKWSKEQEVESPKHWVCPKCGAREPRPARLPAQELQAAWEEPGA